METSRAPEQASGPSIISLFDTVVRPMLRQQQAQQQMSMGLPMSGTEGVATPALFVEQAAERLSILRGPQGEFLPAKAGPKQKMEGWQPPMPPAIPIQLAKYPTPLAPTRGPYYCPPKKMEVGPFLSENGEKEPHHWTGLGTTLAVASPKEIPPKRGEYHDWRPAKSMRETELESSHSRNLAATERVQGGSARNDQSDRGTSARPNQKRPPLDPKRDQENPLLKALLVSREEQPRSAHEAPVYKQQKIESQCAATARPEGQKCFTQRDKKPNKMNENEFVFSPPEDLRDRLEKYHRYARKDRRVVVELLEKTPLFSAVL